MKFISNTLYRDFVITSGQLWSLASKRKGSCYVIMGMCMYAVSVQTQGHHLRKY